MAFQRAGVGSSAYGSASLSWTDTVPATANYALVFFATALPSGILNTSNVGTASLGGTAMTIKSLHAIGSSGSATWYLGAFELKNPPTGSRTVSLSLFGTVVFSRATAVYYSDVSSSGTAVTVSTSSGSSMSQSITSSDSSYIYAQSFVNMDNAGTATSYNQTLAFNLSGNSSIGLIGGDAVGNGSTLTFTATRTGSSTWGSLAIPLIPIAGTTTTLTPPGANVAVTGTAPKLEAQLKTSGASVTVTGTAPSLVTESVLTPAAASATVTGTAPNLDLIVTPPGGSLTGALITVTGSSPTLSTTLVTTGATITITGGLPSTAGASVLTPAAATITVTGSGPKLSVNFVPPSTTLPVTGTAPTLVTVSVLSPTPAAIVISGATPNVINPITLTPAKATITVTGGTATLTVAVYTSPVATPKHTITVRREQRVLVVEGSRIHTVRRASRFTEA